MTDKKPADGQPVPHKKYTPASKAECVGLVAAGARQTAVARSRCIKASRAERNESKRLRAGLKRVEIERDILKKALTIFAKSPP